MVVNIGSKAYAPFPELATAPGLGKHGRRFFHGSCLGSWLDQDKVCVSVRPSEPISTVVKMETRFDRDFGFREMSVGKLEITGTVKSLRRTVHAVRHSWVDYFLKCNTYRSMDHT